MRKFLLGVITVVCIIPILNEFVELVCTHLEALKIKPTKKVLEGQTELQELQEKLNPEYQATSAIGFEVPNCDDYYEEDGDFDNKKNKIGFY